MIATLWPPQEDGAPGTLTAAQCRPGLRMISIHNNRHIYVVDRVGAGGLIDLHCEDNGGRWQETARRPNYFYPVVPLMTLGED